MFVNDTKQKCVFFYFNAHISLKKFGANRRVTQVEPQNHKMSILEETYRSSYSSYLALQKRKLKDVNEFAQAPSSVSLALILYHLLFNANTYLNDGGIAYILH